MNQVAQTITLQNLTPQEVNVLIAGLGKLPLEFSADVWLKVKQQAEAQLAQQPEVDLQSDGSDI